MMLNGLKDFRRIYQKMYLDKMATYTRNEGLYHNLDKMRYFKNTATLTAAVATVSTAGTYALAKNESTNLYQKRYGGPFEMACFGFGLFILQRGIRSSYWPRAIPKFYDKFLICRPALNLNLKSLYPHLLNPLAGESLVRKSTSVISSWSSHLTSLFLLGAVLSTADMSASQLACTYLSAGTIASLTVCSLACLRRLQIQKFIYNYGAVSGLHGLLGFQLFNWSSTEPLKISGVYRHDTEKYLNIQSNYAAYAVTAMMIGVLVADVAFLRIWSAGKLSGTAVAFLVGATQAQVHSIGMPGHRSPRNDSLDQCSVVKLQNVITLYK